MGFIFFRRFFLSVTRPKLPLDQIAIGTLDHATWDVNSPKAVETLMYGISLLCIKYIFFWFYGSIRFKANVEYTEKGIRSAMECADVAGFTFVT